MNPYLRELYIGVDLGGSHIESGIFTEDGNLLSSYKAKLTYKCRDEVVNVATRQIKDLMLIYQGVKAVGFGSPGPLDPVKGTILNPPNLPNLNNFKVVEFLTSMSGLPAFLLNDADAAVLGEAWTGAAKGCTEVVMLTLGTGVGSGIISGGRLQRGIGQGGEWGHTSIFSDGRHRVCSCGYIDCLEAFVSTGGLQRTASEYLIGTALYELADSDDVSIEMAAGLKAGNQEWEPVMNLFIKHLAAGLRNIICVHQPECIILGGGIALGNWGMCERVITALKSMKQNDRMLSSLFHGIEIKPSILHNAGLAGAAKHAINCMTEKEA